MAECVELVFPGGKSHPLSTNDKASFLLVPQKTLSDNCASSFDIFPCHVFFEASHTNFLRHLIVKNSLKNLNEKCPIMFGSN